jgi:cyclopropane fatty-acyl-phospholipid synthase-like methyltransferase
LRFESASDAALREGHYATKQIFCRDRLIAWSHQRRFETGLRLAQRFKGQRLLDYGCGDGTFLALLQGSTAPAGEAVGAELDAGQVTDCEARLGRRGGLAFVRIAALHAPEHTRR